MHSNADRPAVNHEGDGGAGDTGEHGHRGQDRGQSVDALAEAPDAPMSTVVHAAEERAIGDPNRVKVVLDRRNNAIYFSRNPVPARRPGRRRVPRPGHPRPFSGRSKAEESKLCSSFAVFPWGSRARPR